MSNTEKQPRTWEQVKQTENIRFTCSEFEAGWWISVESKSLESGTGSTLGFCNGTFGIYGVCRENINNGHILYVVRNGYGLAYGSLKEQDETPIKTIDLSKQTFYECSTDTTT